MAGTETPKAPSYGWSAKVHYSDTLPYGEGDQFSFIRRIIPDFTFNGSTNTDPSVNVTL